MKKSLGDKAVVAPLPVFVVATYDENGVPNAMNVAWGTQCGYHEITMLLAPHKTTENLKIKGAFTLSFATKNTLNISDYFGIESGYNANKIAKAGVHVTKSATVDAPVIEEYPLTLECEVVEMREIGDDYQVMGRIKNVLVDENMLDEKGRVDFDKMDIISFDSVTNSYRILGGKVGRAFYAGLPLKMNV